MTKRKRSTKLTPCEEKALVTLQAQQIKEKEARAKKRAKKAKEKESRTILGGQALPSYSDIKAPTEISEYSRQQVVQVPQGLTQVQQDIRSIGTNFASNLVNYAFMNAGRWNEIPQRARQQVPQAAVPQAPRQGGQRLGAGQGQMAMRRQVPLLGPAVIPNIPERRINVPLLGAPGAGALNQGRMEGVFEDVPEKANYDMTPDELMALIKKHDSLAARGLTTRSQKLSKLIVENWAFTHTPESARKDFQASTRFGEWDQIHQRIWWDEETGKPFYPAGRIKIFQDGTIGTSPVEMGVQDDKEKARIIKSIRNRMGSNNLIDSYVARDRRIQQLLGEFEPDYQDVANIFPPEAQPPVNAEEAPEEKQMEQNEEKEKPPRLPHIRYNRFNELIPAQPGTFIEYPAQLERELQIERKYDATNTKPLGIMKRNGLNEPVETMPGRTFSNSSTSQLLKLFKTKQQTNSLYEGLGDFFERHAAMQASAQVDRINNMIQQTVSVKDEPSTPMFDFASLTSPSTVQGSDVKADDIEMVDIQPKQLNLTEVSPLIRQRVQKRAEFRSAYESNQKLNDALESWYTNFENQTTLPSAIPPTPPNVGTTMTRLAGITPAKKRKVSEAVELQTPEPLKQYPAGDTMGTPLTQESSAQQYQRAFYEEQNEFKAKVATLGKDVRAHVDKVNQVAGTLNKSSANSFYSLKTKGRLQDEFEMPPNNQAITLKQRTRYATYPQSIKSLLSEEFPNYQFQIGLNQDHVKMLRGVQPAARRGILKDIVASTLPIQPPPQVIPNSAASEAPPIELEPFQRFEPPVQPPVDTTGSINASEEGDEFVINEEL